jgi:hypothetical protein
MPDAGGSFAVTPESLTALAGSLGSAVVAAALHHFVTGWRDGRAQIGVEVDGLASMLRQASEVYASTDGDLATAIPGAS